MQAHCQKDMISKTKAQIILITLSGFCGQSPMKTPKQDTNLSMIYQVLKNYFHFFDNAVAGWTLNNRISTDMKNNLDGWIALIFFSLLHHWLTVTAHCDSGIEQPLLMFFSNTRDFPTGTKVCCEKGLLKKLLCSICSGSADGKQTEFLWYFNIFFLKI